jgi:hypothetical protein
MGVGVVGSGGAVYATGSASMRFRKGPQVTQAPLNRMAVEVEAREIDVSGFPLGVALLRLKLEHDLSVG